MREFSILPITDNKKYSEFCNFIRDRYSIAKERELIDVDGTQIRVFELNNGKKIDVLNDYCVDALYAKANIDISDLVDEFNGLL